MIDIDRVARMIISNRRMTKIGFEHKGVVAAVTRECALEIRTGRIEGKCVIEVGTENVVDPAINRITADRGVSGYRARTAGVNVADIPDVALP